MSVYHEKKWGKTVEGEYVVDGYVFRGKIRFKKAINGLKKIMVKGAQKDYGEYKFKILDVREKGTGLEAEIEVETKKLAERGNAIIQLIGPNNRKEYVAMILKLKASEAKFVVFLAEGIVKPMIEDLVMDKGTGHDEKVEASEQDETSEKDDNLKTIEKFKCEMCDKSLKSNQGLKTHKTKTHRVQENKEVQAKADVHKTDKIYEEKCENCEHIESANRKYLALRKLLKHKEEKHKSTSSVKLIDCSKCEYKVKDRSTMKRHI